VEGEILMDGMYTPTNVKTGTMASGSIMCAFTAVLLEADRRNYMTLGVGGGSFGWGVDFHDL